MVIYMDSTAATCARMLLSALESGSRPQIEKALQRAEMLGTAETRDARENEFRDLLEAVVQAMNASERRAAGNAQRDVAVRMLAHLAQSAA
jgi:hypothetical protein